MLKIILIILGIYLFFVGFMYITQRSYLYLPQPGSIDPKIRGLPEVKLIKIVTSDGIKLNAWYHHAKNKTIPTIIYLHGNYGNIGDRAFIISPYIRAGFGVLLLGYRGYSGNAGSPTELNLYKDAHAAINFLHNQGIPYQCIVLYGNSLGSAIAIKMATEYSLGALILQSTFTSMTDVASKHYPFLPVHWLLKDRFESYKIISTLKLPKLFIHGEDDYIIPFSIGKTLFDIAPEPKLMKVYANAGHNTLPNVSNEVINFIKKYKICDIKD